MSHEKTVLRVLETGPKADAAVIDALEHALECARNGEITQVAVIGSTRSGGRYLNFSCIRFFDLIGCIEDAKYTIQQWRDSQ